MRAVRSCLRFGWRSRFRAWIALALLVGLFGGAVIGAAASARRTDSALARFLAAHNASDVVIGDTSPVGLAGGVDLDRASQLPQIADYARFTPFILFVGTADNGRLIDTNVGIPSASADGKYGRDIDRLKVLHGRRPDPSKVDEVTVSNLAAKQLGIHVGSTVRLRFVTAGNVPNFVTTVLGQLEARTAGRPGTTPYETLADGPDLSFRVVGIHVSPLELPPTTAGLRPSLHLTPAFQHKYGAQLAHNELLIVRLHRGALDLPAFKEGVERLSGGQPVAFVNTRSDQAAKVQRSIHLQAIALWIFAVAAALGGSAVVGQVITRRAMLESGENATLRALGMTRRELWLRAIVWNGTAGAAGALVSLVVGVALSPLAPIGLARTIEPQRGLSADGLALSVGAVATLLGVTTVAAIPAWLATGALRPASRRLRSGIGVRRAATARALSRWGAPPPAIIGAQMALERRAGQTAVPVRSSIAAGAIAVAVIAAATGFGASLDRLLGTPRLYGTAWDFEIGGNPLPDTSAQIVPGLQANPMVGSFAAATTAQVRINELRVDALAIQQVRGTIPPVVLSGRAPTEVDEIMVGTRTLSALHAHIGYTVAVSLGESRRNMTIVGTGVLPDVGDLGQLGRGAAMTHEALTRMAPSAPRNLFLIRFKPGVDVAAESAKLQEAAAPVPSQTPRKPADLVNFGQATNLPSVLAILFALAGTATLAQMLVNSLRRRARELGILRTIGFVPNQVAATLAWEATTIALVACLIGLPLGVAAGRVSWSIVAHQLGIVSQPVVPLAELALLAGAAVVVANLVAVVPGRLALRITPAAGLRTE